MKLEKLKWLIGQWEGIQGNGIYHEEWEISGEEKFTGRAYSIKKGEISNPEKLSIQTEGEEIFYTAEVAHNPGPVKFKMTFNDEDTFVFENPQHDFPKKITYKRNKDNELTATIEAENGAKLQKFDFNLRRL